MAKKLSDQDVADAIDMDGIGYALEHGISADRIKSPKLSELWDYAKEAIQAINNYLDEANVEREGET